MEFSEVAPLLRVAEPRKESGPARAKVVSLDSVKSHNLIKTKDCIGAARIEASHAFMMFQASCRIPVSTWKAGGTAVQFSFLHNCCCESIESSF